MSPSHLTTHSSTAVPDWRTAHAISQGLDLLRIDSALECVGEAQACQEQRHFSRLRELVKHTVQIVGELRSSLEVKSGGPFAVNMGDLCDYLCRELTAIHFADSFSPRQGASLKEVSDLLRAVREAWTILPLGARSDV